jgi:dipeptidyl aminopeptidase/acylaminoacyl peptidase
VRQFASFTALLLLSPFLLAPAQSPKSSRVPTIDQSLEMQNVSSPRISPDGKHVVYEQSRTEWDTNAFATDLWLADTATGERHRLSAPAGSSHGAAWSPDGRWIAFLSSRPAQIKDSPKDKTQLYVMPLEGGEAQQLTRMEKGVEGFEWAPDSKRIALAAEAPESKAMKDREETFGEYHVFHADYQMIHLWLLDLPTTDAAGRSSSLTEPKPLTSGETFSVGDFAFSPDGKRIAFSAQRDPDLISDFSADIYTVNVADGAVKRIVSTAGPDGNPHWSPDGTQIAYTTSDGSKFFFYSNHRIAVVGCDGGTPRVLTSSFDEDPDLLKWGPEGIYFSAQQKTASALFLLDANNGAVTKIETPGSEIVGQFSFSTDFKRVAYRGAGANQFAQIYSSALPSMTQPVQITHAGEQMAGFDLARREVVRWKSGDGTAIEGILYKPADFDPKKKYPLLVVIHGGPTGVDMPMIAPDRYYPMERFVAKRLDSAAELSGLGGIRREVSRA